jgi:hypothetical protein
MLSDTEFSTETRLRASFAKAARRVHQHICNARHQGRSRFREHQPFDRRSSERAEFRTLTGALRLSLVHLDYKPTWASIPARNSNTAENRAPLNLVLLSDQRSVGSNFGSYQGHTLLARYSIMSLFSALDAQYGSS